MSFWDQSFGQLITRFGNYKILLIIGSGIAAIGVLLLSTINPHSDKNVILAFMAINGLGDGFIMITCQIAIQNAFKQEVVGTATASFQFFKNLGSSIGLHCLAPFLQMVQQPKSLQLMVQSQYLHRLRWCIRSDDYRINFYKTNTHTQKC